MCAVALATATMAERGRVKEEGNANDSASTLFKEIQIQHFRGSGRPVNNVSIVR